MNKIFTSAFLSLIIGFLAQGASAQEIKGDAQAGATKNAMCIGCHGIKGYQANFPEVYKVPKIAGQSATYIASALKAYQAGDRKHPTMRAIAASLTEQDMADLAAYYAQLGKVEGAPALPATPAVTPSEKVAAIIAKSACTSCHGANFSKPLDASQPKLAGQHKDYLYAALKSYTVEGNSKVGRSNAIMSGVAKNLSLEDMKEVTAYISSLDGEIQTVSQHKFR
jgi:cytochrome c553